MHKSIWAAAAVLMLGACNVEVGGNDGANDAGSDAAPVANAAAPAAAKAEEGQIAFKAKGMEFDLSVPGMGRHARADDDDGLIYPGAAITGLNIDATGGGKGGGALVSMRFTSPDAPEKVAAWYRDAARAAQFALTPETARGPGLRLEGSTKDEGDTFGLDLQPKDGGGTEAALAIRDRSNA